MSTDDVMMLDCGRCWEGGGDYNYGGKRDFCVAEPAQRFAILVHLMGRSSKARAADGRAGTHRWSERWQEW